MPKVCPKCGMPKELCVCGAIEREAQKIKVSVEKRRYGKLTTVIEGITENAKEIVSKLKQELACGGTFKENHIELQGDHKSKIKDVLVKLGYEEDQIELS
jgi:translation initiation factor 1